MIDRAGKRLLEYESSAYGYLVNTSVAQLVAQFLHTEEVVGSSPAIGTNKDTNSIYSQVELLL